MHRLAENMFLLSPRQDHFSSSTKKFLGPTPPFLHFKNSDNFTQIQEERPCQTPVFVLLLYVLEIGHIRRPSQFKIK